MVIILVAENLGHIKAVTAMTGKDMDQYMGRAFIGDGVATMVSASVGGTGVTTWGLLPVSGFSLGFHHLKVSGFWECPAEHNDQNRGCSAEPK